MLVCLPLPLGWLQREVHPSDQPDQGDRTVAISMLLQSSWQHLQDPQKWSRSSSADCVCTINTMLNVQTEMECRQHAAANAIMVTQELSDALLKAAVGLVFPPSTHLILKKTAVWKAYHTPAEDCSWNLGVTRKSPPRSQPKLGPAALAVSSSHWGKGPE